MQTFARILLVALAFWSSGCALSKVSVSQNRRVGVVSLIPDKVETKYVGLWAFGNKSGEADVPEARFGETVRDATASTLRAKGFQVVPLETNQEALVAPYLKGRGYFATLLHRTAADAVKPQLKSFAAANQLQMLAVVVPEPLRTGGEAAVGVGNFGFGTISTDKEAISIYSRTTLLMLDPTTLAVRASRSQIGGEAVPGVPFEKDFRRYSPAQQQAIIQAMKNAYRKSVENEVAGLVAP